MQRQVSRIKTAINLINSYSLQEPFAIWIKKFFASDKKYGSTDRKEIAHLCYCFFRCGYLLKRHLTEETIIMSRFLCDEKPGDFLNQLRPEWVGAVSQSLEQKCAILGISYSDEYIFPFERELSKEVDHLLLAKSFIKQPYLFLRIRPGYHNHVVETLRDSSLNYFIDGETVTLTNSLPVDKLLKIDKEVVIQDLSSQRVAELMRLAGSPGSGWDCCAGSGGKSILAYDIFKDIDLTVSDKRKAILKRLEQRFKEAGIKKYTCLPADLENVGSFTDNFFDLIIADVPCTGSGTWSRTPEQLYYFNEKKIEEYAMKQRMIINHTLPLIKKGGYYLYITCSVFSKENEKQCAFIRSNGFELMKEQLLAGYDKRADTLFAAMFHKPL
jgi:16S rRNA (cytosine967-C5)-methyltransferase